MIIRPLLTVQEAEICVDMYLAHNEPDFLPADRKVALRNLITAAKRKKFVVVIEDNGIRGFLLATVGGNLHTDVPILNQNYYCSNYTGTKAVKAVVETHKALIDYAEENKIAFILSSGSHQDETNIFARILERNGWKRRHFLACWHTSHAQRALA